MGPEAAIQHAILSAARWRRDISLWRQNTGAMKVPDPHRRKGGRFVRFGHPGAADITGVLRGGRRIEIEVKAPHGRLSALQKDYGDMITAMGGLYVVAYSPEEAFAAIDRALKAANDGA